MAFDRYARNVRRHAKKLLLATPLDESDLALTGLIFKPVQGDEFRVHKRSMDAGTRIFFQYYGTKDGVRSTGLFCSDLRHEDRAPKYFAELWSSEADENVNPAIWALMNSDFVEVKIIWAY